MSAKAEYWRKALISRSICTGISLAVIAGLLIWMDSIFTIVLSAPRPVYLVTVMFVIVAYGLGWIVRGFWKDNSSTQIYEMGPMALRVHIAECTEVYQDKYESEPVKEKTA
tara:strand:+ start:617 stop:949 length:333 start_codon:yes stop_codon:yes gene_type:complete